jgi:magnesium chelatase family protein
LFPKYAVTSEGHTRLLYVEANFFGAALHAGNAELVRVEVLLSRGLPKTTLVGMPDLPAKEARERLPSALAAFGYSYPKAKVLFNLVPAQIPKKGMPLDLAMAAALLHVQGVFPRPEKPVVLLAELDLRGRLRAPARGTLLAALRAGSLEPGTAVITAMDSAAEAAIAPGIRAIGCKDLGQVVELLQEGVSATPGIDPLTQSNAATEKKHSRKLEDVRGQSHARWAGILAVSGRHPLLLQGPPGTGKSMLAHRLADLMPPLDQATAMQVARMEALVSPVHQLPTAAPYRAPHPSVSAQGIFGGGRPLRPGELSRAHGGLLFLDELPEFQRPVLEGLRQPLEDKEVRLQRAQEWAHFPADVLLIAARNPCPCGYSTHPTVPCECTPYSLNRYRNRTSGPLLDRFDLFAEMSPVASADLQGPESAPTSVEARTWMENASKSQQARRQNGGFGQACNAGLEELKAAGIQAESWRTMIRAAERLQLSGRGVLRCLRVARTLADGEGNAEINHPAVLRALSFRPQFSLQESAIS